MPVSLANLQGTGETVSNDFTWPACEKAVFIWRVDPNSSGTASLILKLHKKGTDEAITLVNAFTMDTPAGNQGSALQPLSGGQYYLSTENIQSAWGLNVECQDNTAPVGSSIDLQGIGDTVTANYQLAACNKSVFVWSVEPNPNGTASLILHLHKVNDDRRVSLANEFKMDQAGPARGETLQALDGGLYYLVIGNSSGPWIVKWECRD